MKALSSTHLEVTPETSSSLPSVTWDENIAGTNSIFKNVVKKRIVHILCQVINIKEEKSQLLVKREACS